jgi:hypothetical protein
MRKRARRISYIFDKKEGRRTYQRWYRDKASPSFWWDRDRGAGTFSSSDETVTGGPVGLLPPMGPR